MADSDSVYNEKKRNKLEVLLAGIIAAFLLRQRKRIVNSTINKEPIDWSVENDLLYTAITPTLVAMAVETGNQALAVLPGGVDPAVIHEGALRFLKDYGFDLIKNINDKTAGVVREAVSDFLSTPGMTRRDLEDLLSPTFGPVRAEMISVTETTRALAEGEKIVSENLQKLGIQILDIWNTDNDDKVCPICAPRNGKARGDGWVDDPPAHPRCRCWITHKVKR